jgi:hypothetical protein
MFLGMSIATYTLLHVVISLAGIGSGLILLYGFLNGKRFDRINTTFLVTTVLTSVSGFGFPFEHLLPSHIVGLISLVFLAVATSAWYAFHLIGSWRAIYVVSAVTALYLNVFVLVAQSFAKVSALKALAPTQKEPPFAIAQLVVLLVFGGLTILSVRKFHPQPAAVDIRARAAA